MARSENPTAMAVAFINATAQQLRKGEANIDTGKGHWVARHVALRVEDPRFKAFQRLQRKGK